MLRLIIDPERPNPRQLSRIHDILANGGLIIYPTDTGYGLGCDMMNKKSVEKVYAMKGKNRKHPLSFICPDLKNIAKYAVVSNTAYKLMKRILPGAYTVILPASHEAPRLMLSKRATVGIRIPDTAVSLQLVELLGNPIVTTSVPLPDGVDYDDPDEIAKRLPAIDGFIDCGIIAPTPSTILDLCESVPKLIRQGKGSIDNIPDIVIESDDDE